MSKIKKIAGIFIVCLIANAAFLVGKTFAYTCNDSAVQANPSLSFACSQSSSVARGTMWISSESDQYSVSSVVNLHSRDDATVYVHGSIFYGSSTWATYIKFVKGRSRIEGTADGRTAYQPLRFSNTAGGYYDHMWREGVSRPWSSDIVSSAVATVLDVEALILEEEGNGCTTDANGDGCWIDDDGNHHYQVPLQAFRCFSGYTPSVGNSHCYSDTSILTVVLDAEMFKEYYSRSNVSMENITNPEMTSKYETTGIVVNGEAEAVMTSVEKDETVRIVFSHNPYSNNTEGHPGWSVYRYWYSEDAYQVGQTFTPFSNNAGLFEVRDAVGGSAIGTFIAGAADLKYTPGGSDFNAGTVVGWRPGTAPYEGYDLIGYTDSGGVSSYISRDALDIKFTTEGTWVFCEVISVGDELTQSSEPDAKSKACAKVVVGSNRQYYSVSNAKNSTTLGYATTGIVNWARTATSTALPVNVGESVEIVFSHNIYTDRKTEQRQVDWKVTRDWTGNAGVGYTISPATNNNIAGEGSDTMNLAEAGYYTVDGTRQDDGYGNKYIVRESFVVTFTADTTQTFCETVEIEGTTYTTSCVTLIARTTMPQTCTLWTPQSYRDSATVVSDSATTGHIISETSLTSKIENESLTITRGSTGRYANWLGYYGVTGDSWRQRMESSATTYAMPTDTIKWVSCYYPGVQYLAEKSVVTDVRGDYEPRDGNSTLATTKLKDLTYTITGSTATGTWTNRYAVQSSTTSSNGVFRASRWSNPVGAPTNVIPVTDVLSRYSTGTNPFTWNVNIRTGSALIRESSNDYDVLQVDDAGKIYTEMMTTPGVPYKVRIDYAYHTWTCCGLACTACHVHNNTFETNYNYAEMTQAFSGTLTSGSQVIVPYNFINTASFGLSAGSEDVVYAGDQIGVVNSGVTINNRNNDVTEAEYTTQVDQAEVRLIAYVSDQDAQSQINWNNANGEHEAGDGERTPYDSANDANNNTNICTKGWLVGQKQCMEVNKYNDGTTTLNPDGELGGYTHQGSTLNFDGQYNVYDASAGDYMCFVIAVFPWRSGPEHDDTADKKIKPEGTESKWLITAPQCKQIAKKPSVQVLGSSICTNGGVTSTVSRKHNLFASTVYTPGIGTMAGIGGLGNPAIYFGSFDEQGVVANGLVNRFASGAAVGRVTTNAAGYGSTNNDFCNRWVPLTFANYSKSNLYTICGNGFEMAGQAGITDASIVDREALVDYFIPINAEIHSAGSYDIGGGVGKEVPNGSGKDIRYINADGDVTIVASSLGQFQTRVVRAAGDVKISGNITYDGLYNSMAEVPKAVIYASGDIHIGCDVSRIDAILIAGSTVWSCNDYTVENNGDMENAERSLSQLVINGAILATKVELERTYGSAAGEKSGLAAEVVNYDTSVLVWGRSAAGSNDSNAMSTVYMHELAPRY